MILVVVYTHDSYCSIAREMKMKKKMKAVAETLFVTLIFGAMMMTFFAVYADACGHPIIRFTF